MARQGGAVSRLTESVRLEREDVDQLGQVFRGELIAPEDSAYAQHRKVWNGSIDRRPDLIARCAGVSDVRAAVRVRASAISSSPCGAEATASLSSPSATAAWSSTSG